MFSVDFTCSRICGTKNRLEMRVRSDWALDWRASVRHSNRFQFVCLFQLFFFFVLPSFASQRLSNGQLKFHVPAILMSWREREKSDVLEMKCASSTCLAISYNSVNSNYYNFEMPIDQIAINLLKFWLAWHRREVLMLDASTKKTILERLIQ